MYIHFSGKWPKGWFLESYKAKNYTNEARKKKKGRIARVFIFGSVAVLGRKKIA